VRGARDYRIGFSRRVLRMKTFDARDCAVVQPRDSKHHRDNARPISDSTSGPLGWFCPKSRCASTRVTRETDRFGDACATWRIKRYASPNAPLSARFPLDKKLSRAIDEQRNGSAGASLER
jgi:hypothetical protein